MMHTMNQDLSKLCYYFYLRMKLESTVLVLRILMIIIILHSIEYRNVLLHNGAGNFLLDTNYISCHKARNIPSFSRVPGVF